MHRSPTGEQSNDCANGDQYHKSTDQIMQVSSASKIYKMIVYSQYYLCYSGYIPEKEPLTWMFWKKRRYIVVVLAFFGFFNVYSLRVNLSVAIVAMTENRTVDYGNGTKGHVCREMESLIRLSQWLPSSF